MFLFFLALGLSVAFYPTISSGFRLMQTDIGDTRFNNYIMEHGYQWISGNILHNKFWSPPFFFSYPNVAAYSDILLGSAPIYWFFRSVGFMTDTSFQLWTIAVSVFNYISMHCLLRNGFCVSSIASVGGAYLFTFASIRLNQFSHPQLLPQFFTVMVLYFLIKGFLSSREKISCLGTKFPWLGLVPVFSVLQIYAGFYLGWFLFLGLVTMATLSMFIKSTRRELFFVVKHNFTSLLAAILISMVALSWMVYHYLQAPIVTRDWKEISSMIPRLISWVNFGPDNIGLGWLGKNSWCQHITHGART